MNKSQKSVLAWHYTLGANLLGILENGHILPTDQPDTPVTECPVVWFSLNQYYDPSAAKSIELNGVKQPSTLPVMRQLGNGVYRLGISPAVLLSGEALRRQAHISKDRWKALVKKAQGGGNSASDWLGSIDPVVASDCVIEMLNDDLRWVRVAS
jgi:hypothetical protein